jgi:hypothetical protein
MLSRPALGSTQTRIQWVPDEEEEFESRWGQEFSLPHVVETGYEVHPNSYPMGTGPRDRSLSPGGGKNFHFSKLSRLALGSTQTPIQWVPGGSFPGGKVAGA